MRPARLVDVAFGAALAGALLAAFAPLGRLCEATERAPGGPIGPDVCRATSIFQVDGAWVLFVVSVPVLIALVPALVRRRKARIAAATLLWACCVVASFSVGLFFVPSAVLMTIAAARREPTPSPTPV